MNKRDKIPVSNKLSVFMAVECIDQKLPHGVWAGNRNLEPFTWMVAEEAVGMYKVV